ncbi:MAG TPA: TlpA disulfide reductase family protein [Allosphingosinicella sp.]|nr:TlpA disulfide reductase family protein [Allosphingosinicella sp.]
MRYPLWLLPLLALAACQKQPPAQNGSVAAATPTSAPTAGKVDRSHAGHEAPDTDFQDPDGDPTSLAELGGKPALVNFWATWCAPCKKELPTLDALAAEQGDKLQVVTIAEDDAAKAATYLAQAKFAKLEGWADPKLGLTDALKIADLPTTILFDAKGKEVWRVRGELDWKGAQAKALVAEAYR